MAKVGKFLLAALDSTINFCQKDRSGTAAINQVYSIPNLCKTFNVQATEKCSVKILHVKYGDKISSFVVFEVFTLYRLYSGGGHQAQVVLQSHVARGPLIQAN